MIAVPGGRHPGILLLVFQAVSFQLAQLVDNMGHIHPLHHLADVACAGLRHTVTGGDVGNVGGSHMVTVLTEAVANSSALIAQAEEVTEGRAGLLVAVIIACDQGHIVDPVHQLISAHGDIVEGGEAGEQILVFTKLHHHVHVEDGHTGLVIEIPNHGADGHVGRAMEAEIDLALEAPPLQTSGLLRTAGTKWEFLAELFHNGIRESEQAKPGWELAVIGNTITLLTQLNRAYQDTASYPLHAEEPALLDRAMAYIEENLSGKITLEEAARRLFVSQSTITQTFRKKMGVSFYRCVTQRRLIAAKSLIGEGVQLESVGHLVGFSDYSTFYRAFKQEFGISPRQYRKLQEALEPEH